MTLLAQQELVEPAPPRRLIVPYGCESWWGCDPSSKRVALSGVLRLPDGSLDRWVASHPFVPADGAQRLSGIYWETRRFCEALIGAHPWPGIVFVEQPSGKQDNPALSYAVGVTMAGIHDGLRYVTGRPVAIETVTSGAWKKRACGSGRIYKPKPRSGEEYGVLTWARQNGYAGSSWDEADALGIAEAARRTVALEVR